MLDEQEQAWRSGDADAFARSAMPDIVFTNVVGLFSVGRAGFEAQHRHIFATFSRGSTLRQTVEQITHVRPDVAIVNTLTAVTGFGTLPPALVTHGEVLKSRLEEVLVKDDTVPGPRFGTTRRAEACERTRTSRPANLQKSQENVDPCGRLPTPAEEVLAETEGFMPAEQAFQAVGISLAPRALYPRGYPRFCAAARRVSLFTSTADLVAVSA